MPLIRKFNSKNSEPTSKIVINDEKNLGGKIKKEYLLHRTNEGNLVLKVKIKKKNKQNFSLTNSKKNWVENLTVMDKYTNQYLISECVQTKNEDKCQSQFYVINRLGKVKRKFRWNGRIKVKFRIKNENGDVNCDMFIMKFKGGNFGVLKVNKNVFIKKFKIEEYDDISDFEFRKRMAFVMGYKSPNHGLILFLKFKKEVGDRYEETLKIHQIKNLKRKFERNFEKDSGVSNKFLDLKQFQVIEFCYDRVLVHIYDQLIIYEIDENFKLQILKNVRHFGSGFCGNAFFFDKNVVLLPFPQFICKYFIEENKMERIPLAKTLGKILI